MNDLGLDFFAFLVQFGGGLDLLVAQFGHVDEAFDAFFHFNEETEVGDVRDRALDEATHGVGGGNVGPRVFGQLLDAEGELFVLLIHGEHLGLHGVADLEEFVGMTNLLGPADVGHVDEAVDAVFDADEHAEFGDVLDDAFKDGAFGVLFTHEFPRIGLDLLHAEGDALLVGIDAEDDHFHFVALTDHLGRMTQLAGPGHFGNVHETFDAGFQFDERAVVDEVGHLAVMTGAFGEAGGDVLPRIGHELLEAEGNLLVFLVEGEHLEFEVLTERDHLAGMADALPGHVGDVQEAVEPAEVHEHAVFGDVLGLAGDHLAFGEGLEEVLTLGVAFFFKQHAAGNDDVAAAAVDLEHPEFVFLIHQRVHVRHGAQVHMGTGEERFHAAQVHRVAALDAAHDAALDDAVLFLHVFELVEELHPLGLLERQGDGAFLLVLASNEDVHAIPHLHHEIAFGIPEFGGGNLTFRFEIHVNKHIVVIHADNFALDDGAFLEIAEIGAEVVFQRAFKIKFRVHTVVFHGFHSTASRPHQFPATSAGRHGYQEWPRLARAVRPAFPPGTRAPPRLRPEKPPPGPQVFFGPPPPGGGGHPIPARNPCLRADRAGRTGCAPARRSVRFRRARCGRAPIRA